MSSSLLSAPVHRCVVLAGLLGLAWCGGVCPERVRATQAVGPRVEITLPDAGLPVTIRLREAIEGGRFEDLLHSGFDVRVHVQVELRRIGRVFNDVVARDAWDVIVHFDQFDQAYQVARLDARGAVTSPGSYRRLVDAKTAVALPFTPPIGRPGQRHDYRVRADIESLDLNELDELSRWLRGEPPTTEQARTYPRTALARGVRTLVAQLMGGEVRRLEARSPRFVFTNSTPHYTR